MGGGGGVGVDVVCRVATVTTTGTEGSPGVGTVPGEVGPPQTTAVWGDNAGMKTWLVGAIGCRVSYPRELTV